MTPPEDDARGGLTFKVLPGTKHQGETLLVIGADTWRLAPLELRNLLDALSARMAELASDADTDPAEPVMSPWTEWSDEEPADPLHSELPVDATLLADSVAALRGSVHELAERVARLEDS